MASLGEVAQVIERALLALAAGIMCRFCYNWLANAWDMLVVSIVKKRGGVLIIIWVKSETSLLSAGFSVIFRYVTTILDNILHIFFQLNQLQDGFSLYILAWQAITSHIHQTMNFAMRMHRWAFLEFLVQTWHSVTQVQSAILNQYTLCQIQWMAPHDPLAVCSVCVCSKNSGVRSQS